MNLNPKGIIMLAYEEQQLLQFIEKALSGLHHAKLDEVGENLAHARDLLKENVGIFEAVGHVGPGDICYALFNDGDSNPNWEKALELAKHHVHDIADKVSDAIGETLYDVTEQLVEELGVKDEILQALGIETEADGDE
jgi:hypothetical protein